MNWKPIILTTSLLAVGGIGYAAYRYVVKQKDLLNQYSADLINIGFVSMTADQWVISFTIRLNNKSDIEATMEKMYADIYLNNVYVGYVINDTPALIPAKGTSDIKLQATFAPKVILKNLIDIVTQILQVKDVSYRLNGYVKLKSGFVPVSVPFDESGKLSDFI